MKVAVWHNLPSGGGLSVLRDQVAGLSGRGHEVEVWCPPTAASAVIAPTQIAVHEVPVDRPGEPSRFEELRAAWRGRSPALAAIDEHSARCADAINAFSPDVVLAHPGAAYRPPAIARQVSAPTVLYMHEPNRSLFEATSNHPWVANADPRPSVSVRSIRQFLGELVRAEQARIEVRTETDWVDAFDLVLVNSSFTREAALRAYGIASRVCRPGIDTERFSVADRPSALRGSVLFIGALVEEKNPQFLVEAIASAGPAVERFVWVANYVNRWRREALETQAAAAGVAVDVREAVSHDELIRCYAQADVLVYAPRLEPLGLAPLEANATGLPVVATAEGGMRETIVDGVNGVLTEPDPCAFGKAVADLLGDAPRARALGRSAREHVVAEWSLGDSIDRLERHLEGRVAEVRGCRPR